MAFNVDGIKRPIRRGGQRQTRSAGTLTLLHATGPMQERSPWTETTQPSGFNGRLGSPTAPGNARRILSINRFTLSTMAQPRRSRLRQPPQFPAGYTGQLRPPRRPFFAAQAPASWDSVGSPTEANWATGKVSVLGPV